MVTSSSRLAYGDCYELMDKAIADPKGIKIKFAEWGQASHFRIRLHTARKIDRLDNATLFPEGHQMCSRSVYDQLTMRIRQNGAVVWLRLEKIDAREIEVESLSEPEPEPELFGLVGPTAKVEKHEVEPIRKLVRRL